MGQFEGVEKTSTGISTCYLGLLWIFKTRFDPYGLVDGLPVKVISDVLSQPP